MLKLIFFFVIVPACFGYIWSMWDQIKDDESDQIAKDRMHIWGGGN